MTHRGPFQPLPFCDSVKPPLCTDDCSKRLGTKFQNPVPAVLRSDTRCLPWERNVHEEPSSSWLSTRAGIMAVKLSVILPRRCDSDGDPAPCRSQLTPRRDDGDGPTGSPGETPGAPRGLWQGNGWVGAAGEQCCTSKHLNMGVTRLDRGSHIGFYAKMSYRDGSCLSHTGLGCRHAQGWKCGSTWGLTSRTHHGLLAILQIPSDPPLPEEVASPRVASGWDRCRLQAGQGYDPFPATLF